MKKSKLNARLTFKKESITNLNAIRGGFNEKATDAYDTCACPTNAYDTCGCPTNAYDTCSCVSICYEAKTCYV